MGIRKKQVAIARVGSAIKKKPVWRFDMVDRDGKFAFDLSRKDFHHKEVLQKLMDYGSMTWEEIDRQQHDRGKSKHHYLNLEALSDDAKARIRARHLEEETDAIYSFALQNLLRIIGLRQGEEFYVVWYDPKHEFCPSKK